MTDRDLREKRILIDELMNRQDFGLIANIPGIRIVKDVRRMNRAHNCLSYAMSQKKPGNNLAIIDHQVVGEETKKPEDGDLIFYYNATGFLTHGGIYRGGDLVESKFNFLSHVYEHPRLAVPLWFGDITRTFVNR